VGAIAAQSQSRSMTTITIDKATRATGVAISSRSPAMMVASPSPWRTPAMTSISVFGTCAAGEASTPRAGPDKKYSGNSPLGKGRKKSRRSREKAYLDRVLVFEGIEICPDNAQVLCPTVMIAVVVLEPDSWRFRGICLDAAFAQAARGVYRL
jgi:hypothetical protein